VVDGHFTGGGGCGNLPVSGRTNGFPSDRKDQLVKTIHTPAGVWSLSGVWIENKTANDIVTGPNSNVTRISTDNG
jgi:hypothetical protein